ncbi:Na+/H+ antiporter subunit E [Hoyosella sp. YIM 151337]|uniref:Na+/H+ antiporter subunit E n=1 Tax=Hoyosella sp. YIM 151337 TaxID=2992742 RepID=UPI002235F5C4|nr:Na+/H+ antiporter subunit E [Hoyosella sp. YIM 151337]MCW4353962.1 Na+/H+ antiporter subunit E [Hoyosella sp. YIM 151337]
MTRWRAVALRIVLFGLLWWVITEGEWGVLHYALLVVPISAALSLWLLPPRERRGAVMRRTASVIGLLGWFLWQSVRGGADVAVRALRRPVDLDPSVFTYRTGLPDGLGRVALVVLCSLMPGTLSVGLDDAEVRIHTLDQEMGSRDQLAELEQRLGAVLGKSG